MNDNNADSLVYLVDNEFAIRDSLALIIESTGLTVRSFESAKDFLNNYSFDHAGCLILDVRMPEMSGLELQDELLARGISIPIIFISGHARVSDSAKAFRSGAVDFLEKPFDYELLLKRIKEALQKDVANRKQLNEYLAIKNRLDYLTVREQELLSLIVKGYSNKEMAKELGISNRTVEAHRARIMRKMQAENLADLMVLAARSDVLNDKFSQE